MGRAGFLQQPSPFQELEQPLENRLPSRAFVAPKMSPSGNVHSFTMRALRALC